MWLFPFLLTTLWSQSVQGWYVVFKVGGQGVDTYSSLIELWSAYDVLNDDQAAIVQDTYRVKDMPSYKSNIVRSQWSKVKMAKIGMYKDGQESAYVVFNSTNTDIETWFNASRVIQSSYTDLSIPKAHCSLHNNATDRTFQVISTAEGAGCSTFGGWMMAVDDGGSSSCHWEYGHRKPFFLYSTGNSAAQFIDGSDVADSFVVFVEDKSLDTSLQPHSRQRRGWGSVIFYGTSILIRTTNVGLTLASIVSDDCVSGPCQHEGTCTSSINDYTCQCADQYYGKNCHIHCPCIAGTCVTVSPGDISGAGVIVNGVLINEKPVYPEPGVMIACNCTKGMEGAYCNRSVDDCFPGACMNGGTCVDGDQSYKCVCPAGYFGDTCTNTHVPKEEDSLVAKITLGVVIPLVVGLVIVLVIYGIYMYRHPDKFGRSATYKNYVIAREFVRRSIRRMSGRRPREKLVGNGNKSDEKDLKSDKYADASQVNLGFQDGDDKQYKPAIPEYTKENSEVYNLSADNSAVVAGPSTYEMTDYEQMKAANEKPQRQLGRAYRNKSTSSSVPSTPGTEQNAVVPSSRTMHDNSTIPSPRTPDSSYPTPSPRLPPADVPASSPRYPPGQHVSSSGQYQGQDRPSSVSDDEGRGFGYKPKSPSGKGPYEQHDYSLYPNVQRPNPEPRGRGPSVGSDRSDKYNDSRGNTQNLQRDPRYNPREGGYRRNDPAEESQIQYSGERDNKSRLQGDGQRYDPVDRGQRYDPRYRDQRYNPKDRYDTTSDPQDRYADYEGRSPGYHQAQRRDDLSPGGYPRNRSDDRYNVNYKQPPFDRYKSPGGVPNDRYTDRYEMPYNQAKSPRYTGESHSQYGNRPQQSPTDTGSEHARIVFPVSDGMDEVTI